jgi:hypothetical protein
MSEQVRHFGRLFLSAFVRLSEPQLRITDRSPIIMPFYGKRESAKEIELN